MPAGRFTTLSSVVVVVLSWNHREAVLACIDRVKALAGAEVHSVIVDNASSDDSVATIRAMHPDVTVIEQPVNRGFAGGVNAGLAEAARRGADFAWLLNDDTAFGEASLAPLLAHAAAQSQPALLTPVLRDLDEQGGGPQFVNGVIDWSRAVMGHNLEPADFAARVAAGATAIVAGTALLCDLRVYRTIGPFDERFFAYWEDTDYSVRAARAGFAVAVVPTAVVAHAAPMTSDRPPHYHYYMTRNEALFWRLHGRRSRWRRRWLSASLDAIGRERDLGHDANVDALVDGLWHVWKRRFGPRPVDLRAPGWLRTALVTSPYLLSDSLKGEWRAIARRVLRLR